MRAPDPLFPVLSPRRLVCLALWVPALSLAQSPAPAADAANPSAPTAPLVHQGLRPQPALEAAATPTDWRTTHEAVAAFPRGHADIVRWEARQGTASAPAPTGSAAATGAHHQGHKP